MSEVSAGNIEAFGELFDRFSSRAYGVAYSVCRDDGRAQDATQEAFLSIWKGRMNYRPERGTVAAWLLTVVRYRAVDLARRNGRHAVHWASDTYLEQSPAPDDVSAEVLAQDTADRLRESLALLPEKQQEVIALAYYGQLSHTEIARQLHLAPGTVKGRMRLGLHKLREGMDQATA